MPGISAQGTLLKRGDGGDPETFTTVGQIRDISGLGESLDTIDVTAHDSPSNYEEVIATIIRTGEVTLDINLDPANAQHQGLRSDLQNRTKRNFEVHFPDAGATVWEFEAYVTGYELSAPHDDRLGLSVTLKPTGAISEQ